MTLWKGTLLIVMFLGALRIAKTCQNTVMSCPSTCAVASDLERDEELINRQMMQLTQNMSTLCQRIKRIQMKREEKQQRHRQRNMELTNLISRQQATVDLLTESRNRLGDRSREVTEGTNDIRRLADENRVLEDRIQQKVVSARSACSVTMETTCPGTIVGRDCAEIYNFGGRTSGAYLITTGSTDVLRLVYCDQDTDGGGWTQIHSHATNDVEFNRDWQSYKSGFGQVSCNGDGNYWLGNENIHSVTSQTHQHMRVDVEDWNGASRFALYTHFGVGSESTDYTLTVSGYQGDESGDIGDAFAGHNFGISDDVLITKHKGMPFSTYDRDNDKYMTGNCARHGSGGWWYNSCSAVNLNGKVYEGGYYQKSDTIYGYDNAMIWGPWKGLWYSLKKTSMKIRPASFHSTVQT